MKSSSIQLMIACLVAVGALVAHGIWYAAIAGKSAAVATLQTQIDEKTVTASRLNAARAALTEIASSESAVQSYFVPETGVVAFIDGLQERGRGLGASVGVLSVSTESAAAQSTLALTLSIRGTFDSVLRTLGAIEYAPYAISIRTLSLGQDDASTWHADLSLRIGSRTGATATTTP